MYIYVYIYIYFEVSKVMEVPHELDGFSTENPRKKCMIWGSPICGNHHYAYCAQESGNTRGSFQIFWFQNRKNAGQSSWSPDHVMLRGMADELSSRYCR